MVLYEYNVVSYSVMLNSCNQLLPDSDDIGQLDQVKLECLSILLTSYVNINGNVLSHLNVSFSVCGKLVKLILFLRSDLCEALV